jgi:lycopene cyclase domain-containing protein
MTRGFSYVLLEIGVFGTVVAMTWGRPEWHRLRTRWFLVRAIPLFALWCVVDYIALALGLWRFPAGGTLPWRIIGLPPEEYFVFILHIVMTYFLVVMLHRDCE